MANRDSEEHSDGWRLIEREYARVKNRIILTMSEEEQTIIARKLKNNEIRIDQVADEVIKMRG